MRTIASESHCFSNQASCKAILAASPFQPFLFTAFTATVRPRVSKFEPMYRLSETPPCAPKPSKATSDRSSRLIDCQSNGNSVSNSIQSELSNRGLSASFCSQLCISAVRVIIRQFTLLGALTRHFHRGGLCAAVATTCASSIFCPSAASAKRLVWRFRRSHFH